MNRRDSRRKRKRDKEEKPIRRRRLSFFFFQSDAARRVPSLSSNLDLILTPSLFSGKKNNHNPSRNQKKTGKKGIYGATINREDFCEDDVNFYFEYMGMLAVDGDYARLDRMKSAGLAAVDLLLLMAAGENDAPKVAEMLRAGADTGARDVDGKTAAELATNEQVLELLRDPAKAKTF